MMSDDERIACKDLQERIATLEEQVNELRTILGVNRQGPSRPPEMCIACGNPCQGRGGIGHPVVIRRL